MNPNKEQKKLIENTEGSFLVDAGAGTGKTFTVTERYVEILEKAEPENIFLATFTRNAAEEMSERIAEKSSYKTSKIYNAPISTFHGYCQGLLERHGFNTPKKLGIDSEIENIETLESQIRERHYFNSFYENFRSERPEYLEFYYLIDDSSDLLNLLKSLASRGVIPQKDEWFLNSEEYLDGDFETYREIFRELNRPKEGKNGNRNQSTLRQRIYSIKYKELPEKAPEYSDIAGDYGCKQVRKDFLEKAFDEDREKLKEFIREIYFEYLEYSLNNSYLNFGFMMALAFVTLYSSEDARKQESFDYLMIDEFQDTNEIQLKISLLLAEKPNICVVGDWKQSIYSFQYADIDNIRKFEKRMNENISELNTGNRRVNFDSLQVQKIGLKKNYRSTQKILDAAEQSFELRGNSYESVEKPDLVSLESEASHEEIEVKKLMCEQEGENILHKIQEVVENSTFEEREIDYSDIAVISRTRSFGLELQDLADEYGVPAAYEGGIELFNTSEAKIVLAWLRALRDSRKGWVVILERAGYSLTQVEKIFDEDKDEQIPGNLTGFKDELEELEDLESQLRTILDRYGLENPITEKIIDVLTDVYRSSFMTRSELVQFIEDNIEENEIYEVDTSRRRNCVKIQTIHGAKGLEYPVVFVADVNKGRFPSRNGNYRPIMFDEVIGLRQRKIFDLENSYVFDNWRTEILSRCVGSQYDEERRLMYVAMTRAEKYLFISAENERESRFYEDLELEEERISGEPEEQDEINEQQDILEISRPEETRRRLVSTSEKADLDEALTENTGYGEKIHDFMQSYIENGKRPETDEERKIVEKIDSIPGAIKSEVEFKYPKDDRVYTGRVDLVAETDEKLTIIDLKTSDKFENAQREQLELYREAFEQITDKEVDAKLLQL